MLKTTKKIQAVILAAGESSRFWPFSDNGHKSLFKIAGKTIIEHLVDGLIKNGVKEIIIIHAPGEREKFKKTFHNSKAKIHYTAQEKPLGTGNALKLVAKQINGPFLLVNGDHYQSKEHISKIVSGYKNDKIIFLTQKTDRPWEYAIIEKKNKNSKEILNIIEKPAKGKETSNLRTVGLYLLNPKFISYLMKEPEHPYSLINAFKKYIKDIGAIAESADQQTSSIKYPFDLLNVIIDITNNQKRKIVIGEGTEIKENVVIYGPVYIGKNCFIGANTVIRPNTVIEDNVQIGVGAEIKRSYLGEGTHIHSGYVGDSIIGENCRIGAGFMTANRRLDRKNIKFEVKNKKIDSLKSYLGCVIGANTKIGVRASTMPGTIIGSNCVVGSNTEVKGAVPSGSLVYAKYKMIIKKSS